MNDPHFAAAGTADVPVVLELMQAFYVEESLIFTPKCAEALRQLCGDSSLGRAVLIQQDGKAIGYFILTYGFSLEYEGRTTLLDELYIVPGARGRGLGRTAVETAVTLARKNGGHVIFLEVERIKTLAKKLYGSAGFIVHSRDLMVLTLR